MSKLYWLNLGQCFCHISAPIILCDGEPVNGDFLEEFEGATIPSGWTTEILAGTWDWTFGSGDMPLGPDFPTNAAIFDDDAAGKIRVHKDKLHLHTNLP